MDIAIQFDKYNLGYDRFFFKPVGIIKGTYDDVVQTFVNEYDYAFESICGSNFDCDYFFGNVVSIEELRKLFGKKYTDSELIQFYLDENMEVCYIGSFDSTTGQMNMVEIDLTELEEQFINQPTDSEQYEDALLELDIDKLEKIMQSNDINEIKKELSVMVKNILDVVDNMSSIESNKQPNVEQRKKIEKPKTRKDINLQGLQKEVLGKVIGQDKAVKTVTTRILKNFITTDKENKTHILIAGGTGTGKTEMIELTCKYLGIPCKAVDATSFTQEGYVGSSVDDMICGLINVCNGDVELAQKGILIIDEIDKKCNSSSNETVSSKAVLDSLLKILGRKKFQIENGRGNFIDFDTSNLTVVLTGAFEGIKKGKNNSQKTLIGFGDRTPKEEVIKTEIQPEDFIKYGMTPEIMGRIECIAFTNDLTVENFIEIIYKSKISALKKAKNMYEKDLGIEFKYTYPYVKEIAKKAKLYKTGARGIKRAVEESLEDVDQKVLNSINGKKKIKSIKLTKETAINNKKYYIEYM